MRSSAIRVHLDGWSIEIPQDWDHSFEEGALVMERGGGARVNIAAISKTEGGEADDSDLSEFIEDMGMGAWHRIDASCGTFTGFHLYGDDDEGNLREYWILRAGALILFVDYRPASAKDSGDEDDVGEALSSLRVVPAASD